MTRHPCKHGLGRKPCGRFVGPHKPWGPDNCLICYLYATSPRHWAYWNGEAPPVVTIPQPGPCRHRGEEVGEKVCRECQGNVRVKLFACPLHGPCSISKAMPGVPCCGTCKDYAISLPPPVEVAGNVRHLLYHVYPVRGNGIWQWNLAELRKRISLFNGRRVVAVATDVHTDPVAAVEAALEGSGCEVFSIANVRHLRETATLLPLFERLLPYHGPADVVFHGHAKGVTSERWGPGVRRWTEALISTCLDHWPAVQKLLADYPLAGPFKRLGRLFPESRRSLWHFSGSWRWIRLRDLFQRSWRETDNFWCGSESWPSLHFRAEEAACIVHEFSDVGLTLYGEEYWQQTAGPALITWHHEHQGDRQNPLMLSCILTVHTSHSLVAEAITSVQRQTCPDWELIITGPEDILAEWRRALSSDARVRFLPTGEPPAIGQGTVINRAFRECRGDLVCCLSHDDVYEPGAFGAWLQAAREKPDQLAWVGSALRTVIDEDGREHSLGELPAVRGGIGGESLDCKVDGMQFCTQRAAWQDWPESMAGAVAGHADGIWMDAVGAAVPIHRLDVLVGRHRHTTYSVFTRAP